MPDAGLDADVLLDITKALRDVDRIERALTAATSNIVVTADARAVTAAIDAAVQSADVAVEVVGDASDLTGEVTAAVDEGDANVVITGDGAELTGEITEAVDAGDSFVSVTGDASELTGEVTAAVEAGDSHVEITADTSQAKAAVKELDAAADEAAGSTSRLASALKALGAAAIAKALYEAANAASDLAESTSKATAVFGPATDDIMEFAREAAVNLGLSEQAALEAAGTFGNLFQALGLTQSAAAEMSPEVLQLAADLASFNNLEVDVALEKIRSGLVGEIEPLRGLGISFNAAQVEAKAFELGLADATGEITEGAKVQARWQLIVEQSSIAAGDFARTADGLANQQRTLNAEWDNAVATAGKALLPVLLELVTIARESMIPAFSELAEAVLPSLASILSDLAPLLGITLDLLVLTAPVLEAVAVAVDAIPGPLIAAAAGLLLFNKAFGIFSGLLHPVILGLHTLSAALTGIAATKGISTLAAGMGVAKASAVGLAAAMGTTAVVTGGLAITLGLGINAYNLSKDRARDYQAAVESLAGALETVDGRQQLTTAGLAAWLSTSEQSRFVAKDQIDDLERLGLSFGRVATLAQNGSDGFRSFLSAAAQSGEIELLSERQGALADATSLTNDEIEVLIANGSVLTSQGKITLAGNKDLLRSFQDLAKQTEEVAEQQLAAAVASGDLTQAQVDEALALDDSGEATRSAVDALNELEPALVKADEAAARALAEYGPLAEGILGVNDAIALLRGTAPDVASAITTVRLAVEPTDAQFLSLATTIRDAELSEEEMAAAAALLGTDLEGLTAFVDSATGALDAFVEAALGGLPSIGQAFVDANEDSKVSAQEFIDGLAEQTVAMGTFISNLSTIVTAGFPEVAATLAEQGVEAAGLVAEELAAAQREGNTSQLEELQKGIDERQAVHSLATDFYRNVLGPDFIEASGEVARLASETFGSEWTPEQETAVKVGLAGTTLTEDGKALAIVAGLVGEKEAIAFGQALGLDEETVTEALKAGKAIRAAAAPGGQLTVDTIWAGQKVGNAFGEGMTWGMSLTQELVNAQARKMVIDAQRVANAAARNQSPSKVWRDIGINMGLGLALGLEESTADVVAEAEALTRAAAEGVAGEAFRLDVPKVTLADDVLASLAATQVGLGGTVNETTITFDRGSIVVQPPEGMTKAEASAVGEGIVDGMERRLAERALVFAARTG